MGCLTSPCPTNWQLCPSHTKNMPKSKDYILPFHTNKIVLLLTFSDIFSWGIFLVLNAIVGIYLAGKLEVDTIKFVGIGTAIYYITRGILEFSFGRLLDWLKHDLDEILSLAIGNVLMGVSFIFYPHISSPTLYYLLQIVFGTGTALNLVAWRKLFAQNLDKHREGLEYGTYGMLFSLASALFAFFAGLIANISPRYFDLVLVSVGVTMIASAVFPLLITTIKSRQSKTK